MAIITPEVPFVGMGRSEIRPAETYVKPTDNGLGQVAEALSNFGMTVSQTAAQQKAQKDKMDAMNLDYTVNKAYTERKDGVPLLQQANLIPIDQSTENQLRVARMLGAKDFQNHPLNEEASQLLANPDFLSNRQAYEAQILDIRRRAQQYAEQNPQMGSGFISALDAKLGQLDTQADAAITNLAKANLTAGLQMEAINAVEKARQAAPIKYRSAASAGIDYKYVKQSALPGKDVDNLDAGFAQRLNTMIEAMPPKLRARFKINSAYRSPDHQARIILNSKRVPADLKEGFRQDYERLGAEAAGVKWRAAMRKAGVTKWIAMPGGSNHQKGIAADLQYSGEDVKQWVHANAKAYGLHFRMDHEDWHIEPLGDTRDRQGKLGDTVDEGDSDPDDDKDDVVSKYVNRVMTQSNLEGTGQNSVSSAFGYGQFMPDTWKRFAPDEYKDISFRADPTAGQKTLENYARHNEAILRKNGFDINELNLHLLHFAGDTGGLKLLQASDDTPVNQVLSSDAIRSNPRVLAGRTVGEVKQFFIEEKGLTTGSTAMDDVALARNAIRTVDKENATIGFDNSYKAEVYTDAIIQKAINENDPSVLDYLPPEYLSPERQQKVINAKAQIVQNVRANDNYQYQMQERMQKQATEAAVQEATVAMANGEQVDLRKYADNPEALTKIRAMQELEFNIDEKSSAYNAQLFEDELNAAVTLGDFKKLGFDDTPTKAELVDKMNNLPIRAADREKLTAKLDSILTKESVLASPSITGIYERGAKSIVDAAVKNLGDNVAEQGRIEAEANRMARQIASEVMTNSMDANGNLPVGPERQKMLDIIEQKQIEAIDKLTQKYTTPMTPTESAIYAEEVRDTLRNATLSGDWSKITGDPNKMPRPQDIVRWASQGNRMDPEEIKALRNDIPGIMDIASFYNDGPVRQSYDTFVKPMVRQLLDSASPQDSLGTRLGRDGVSLENKARTIFDELIRQGIEDYTKNNNGKAPWGSNFDAVLKQATKETEERVISLIQGASGFDLERIKNISSAKPSIDTAKPVEKDSVFINDPVSGMSGYVPLDVIMKSGNQEMINNAMFLILKSGMDAATQGLSNGIETDPNVEENLRDFLSEGNQ